MKKILSIIVSLVACCNINAHGVVVEDNLILSFAAAIGIPLLIMLIALIKKGFVKKGIILTVLLPFVFLALDALTIYLLKYTNRNLDVDITIVGFVFFALPTIISLVTYFIIIKKSKKSQ